MSNNELVEKGSEAGPDQCADHEGWEEYPPNFEGSTAFDFSAYRARIVELSPAIFCEYSHETEIQVIDLAPPSSATRTLKYSFLNSHTFEQFILGTEMPKTRIISLCTQNSVEPLKITETTMRKFLTHNDIGPEFLDILFAFGTKPRQSEAGLASMTVKQRPDGSYDMCYLFVYVEESKHGNKRSWPVRQLGVFHRFNPKTKTSLWILLNPMPNSRVQQRLDDSALQQILLQDSYPDLQQLHLLVISSYIHNWRWYINDIGEEFEATVDMALTLNFSRREDYANGLTTLSRLQHLQDKTHPLFTRFKASLSTIATLKEVNAIFYEKAYYGADKFTNLSNELSSYETKFQGYLASVELLRSRSQDILNLLSVTLNLKNQSTSVKINHNMLNLTKDTVDDSATVRVVTVVSLIFLPASFVASLFGMNFFTFQTFEGSGFQMSRQFWVYIALSIPLTLLTVGSWFVFTRKRKRIKAEEQALRMKSRYQMEEV